MRKYLTIIALFMMCSGAYAGPVLNFSDLTSGPDTGLGDGSGEGTIVTIWGTNLGSTQGTSQVYFKDSTGTSYVAAHVYYWENADTANGSSGPAELYTYHKMQEIAFSIPDEAATGVGKIYVTVGGGNSNELDFTVRSGDVYYVKTTGNDGNAGTWSSPFRTMTHCVNTPPTSIGAIYYVCDGVTDADGIIYDYAVGTEASPHALVAYPGATITVGGNASNPGLTFASNSSAYNVTSKILIKGGQSTAHKGQRGLRSVGCKIEEASGYCADGLSGAYVWGSWELCNGGVGNIGTLGVKVYGAHIYDWGCAGSGTMTHTMYISHRHWDECAAALPAWDVGWCFFENNYARGGLQVYDEGNCGKYSGTSLVHHNVFLNQGGPAMFVEGAGSCANDFELNIDFYNNLLINVGPGPANDFGYPAIQIKDDNNNLTGTFRYYNNTIWGYSYYGSSYDDHYKVAVWMERTASTDVLWSFYNNIVVDTQNLPYSASWESGWFNPSSSGNNLWYNGGDSTPSVPPTWDTDPLSTDPLFTNAATYDFSILTGSPAKDAGTTGLDDIDIIGVSRPQGASYDIGAFEFDEDETSTTTTAASTTTSEPTTTTSEPTTTTSAGVTTTTTIPTVTGGTITGGTYE